jgi:hypothetical protein
MVEARSEPSPIPAQRKKFTPAKNKPPVIDQSQAKTDAETMDLHRMPLLAARGPDAAPVKRIGSSACREVGGLGDRGSHGFGARGGGALLGFGDALIVTEPLALGLGAASAALVRAEIASRSCSAIAARMPAASQNFSRPSFAARSS